MKNLTSVLVIILMGFSLVFSQRVENEDLSTMKEKPEKKEKTQKVFYGGTLGFNFGSYFRISVEPLVGYRVSSKFSIGGKFRYEYINDGRYDADVTYHNYGGSLFARYRVIPQIYLHAEPAYMSYQFSVSSYESKREWVPFIFLGGGYVQRVGSNTFLYAEVLFDVLQDTNSPYESGDPFISVGVSMGF